VKRVLGSLAAAIALSCAALSAPAATAAPEGDLEDTSPAVTSMTPEVHHRQSIFSVQFQAAQPKERRFVTSVLAVKDTTDRLFLGQELSCTSPSGVTTIGIETGRNFWQGGLGKTVGSFVLRVNEKGTWTCQSTVNLCEPGDCDSGKGSGTLTLDAGTGGAVSQMKVSQPLEPWSISTRIVTRDTALRPGKSVTFSKTIATADGATPAVVAEVSFSNCIEPTYPNVCASLPSHAINGPATASIGMTVTQVPATKGATCTVVKATRDQGAITRTISAAQHHATFSMEIPEVVLSTSPDCSSDVKVSVTFTALKGNGIAIEGGSNKKPMALVSVGDIDASYQVVPVLQ
jgi:hypothetical protein